MTVQFSCSASVNNPCNTVSGVGITHGLISARKEREREKKKKKDTWMGSFPVLPDGEARLSRASLHADACVCWTAGLPGFTSLCAGTEEGEEKSSDRGRGSCRLSSGRGFACQSPGLQISWKIKYYRTQESEIKAFCGLWAPGEPSFPGLHQPQPLGSQLKSRNGSS